MNFCSKLTFGSSFKRSWLLLCIFSQKCFIPQTTVSSTPYRKTELKTNFTAQAIVAHMKHFFQEMTGNNQDLSNELPSVNFEPKFIKIFSFELQETN